MIDSQLKDRLMAALESGVACVNRGSDPDPALAKAASDADFNVEQTRRLCELFNTARTLHHFERNKDCKEASFDLADSDVVLGIMFDEPETADKLAEDLYDYREYERRDPAAMEDINDDLFLSEKAAEVQLDIGQQASRAYRLYDTQISMAEKLRSEAAQAESIASDTFAKLALDIRHADDAGDNRYGLLCYLRPNAADRVSCHFNRPVTAETVKAACVIDSSPVAPWLQMFDRAENLMFKAASARTLADSVEKEARAFRQQFEHIVSGDLLKRADERKEEGEKEPKEDWLGEIKPVRMGLPAWAATPTRASLETGREALQGASDATAPVRRAVDAGIVGAVKDLVDRGRGASRVQRAKVNADSSAGLANVQNEINLTELMNLDPFISAADPESVLAGYKELLATAPTFVLENKESLRAALRNMIHSGAISVYDTDSYAKLEKTKRELSGQLKIKAAQG